MACLGEPISHWGPQIRELAANGCLGSKLYAEQTTIRHGSRFMGRTYQLYISKFFLECIIEEVQASRYFSILIDESTDRGTKPHLIIYIRYIDSLPKENRQRMISQGARLAVDMPTNNAKTRFLALLDIKHGASAQSIFLLMHHFVFHLLGLQKSRLIGFCSDGASVMRGNKKGVVQLIKKHINPAIVNVHCVAHRLQLAAELAESNIVQQGWFIKQVHYLHSLFSKSVKKSQQLDSIQESINQKPLKMKDPSPTRWLALSEAVTRIKNRMEALFIYTSNSINKVKGGERILKLALEKCEQIYQVAIIAEANLDFISSSSSSTSMSTNMNRITVTPAASSTTIANTPIAMGTSSSLVLTSSATISTDHDNYNINYNEPVQDSTIANLDMRMENNAYTYGSSDNNVDASNIRRTSNRALQTTSRASQYFSEISTKKRRITDHERKTIATTNCIRNEANCNTAADHDTDNDGKQVHVTPTSTNNVRAYDHMHDHEESLNNEHKSVRTNVQAIDIANESSSKLKTGLGSARKRKPLHEATADEADPVSESDLEHEAAAEDGEESEGEQLEDAHADEVNDTKQKKLQRGEQEKKCEKGDNLTVSGRSEVASHVRHYLRVHSFRFVAWTLACDQILTYLHSLSLRFQEENILPTEITTAICSTYREIAIAVGANVNYLRELSSAQIDQDDEKSVLNRWTLSFKDEFIASFLDAAEKAATNNPCQHSFLFKDKRLHKEHTIYFLRKPSEDILYFKRDFKKFIQQCVKNIKAQFPDEDLCSAFDIFVIDAPGILCLADSEQLYNYKNTELQVLYQHFSIENTQAIRPIIHHDSNNYMNTKEEEPIHEQPILTCSFETLRKEYNDLLDFIVKSARTFEGYDFSLEKFWLSSARRMASSSSFSFVNIPNLMKLLDIYLCTPVSNAPCERGFSIQNFVKTDLRNQLSNQTLDSTMRVTLVAESHKVTLENLNFDALIPMFKAGENETPSHTNIRSEFKSLAPEQEIEDQRREDRLQ